MKPLTAADLWKLEEYAEKRAEFRRRVIAHKSARQVQIGPNMTLLFEDRLTVQYQVQEMLRIERIFERAAIDEELAAYNPLIPDGSNWKATCMIEFPDAAERARELAKLKGVEHRIWAQADMRDKVFAVADEDLERANETKTSAVHFLRFELDAASVSALKSGAPLGFGVDHPAYRHQGDVSAAVRRALAADFG
jgi:hypothetical protein